MTGPLAAEARRLRVVEQPSVRDIQARLGVGRDRVYGLLRGVPPPEWTQRPRAKDELRAQAVRLRAEGRSVNDIAKQLETLATTGPVSLEEGVVDGLVTTGRHDASVQGLRPRR